MGEYLGDVDRWDYTAPGLLGDVGVATCQRHGVGDKATGRVSRVTEGRCDDWGNVTLALMQGQSNSGISAPFLSECCPCAQLQVVANRAWLSLLPLPPNQ